MIAEISVDSSVVTWHLRTTAALAVVALAGLALPALVPRWRHRLLAWGMLAAVVVPTLALWLPSAWGVQVAALRTTAAAQPWPAVWPGVGPSILASGVSQAASSANLEAMATAQPFDWIAWFVGAWLVGAGLYAARVAAAAIGSHSLRRNGMPMPKQTRELFASLLAKADVNAQLRITDRISTPIVLGMAQPTVLVPPEALDWSPALQRAVLLHELGHVAQRDHIWFPVMHILRGVLWFNPLAWLVSRRFFAAAEFSADATAVVSGISAPDYAAGLLALARRPLGPIPLLGAAALGRPDVCARIRSLLGSRSELVRLRRVVPVFMGAAGALVCIAMARPAVADAELLAADIGPRSVSAMFDATVAVPKRANRIELHAGRLVARAGTSALDIAAPRGVVDDDQRAGHRIIPLDEFLTRLGDRGAPLVVAADDDIAFEQLVDVLYTAGRANIREYYLEIEVLGRPRALRLDAPRRRAGETGSLPVRVLVTAARDGVVLLAGAEGPASMCKLQNATPETLEAHSVALCDANPHGVSLGFTALWDVSYARLTQVMLAVGRPCGASWVIEAGSGAHEGADAPACTVAMANP